MPKQESLIEEILKLHLQIKVLNDLNSNYLERAGRLGELIKQLLIALDKFAATQKS